jgi:hypothetical protein
MRRQGWPWQAWLLSSCARNLLFPRNQVNLLIHHPPRLRGPLDDPAHAPIACPSPREYTSVGVSLDVDGKAILRLHV